MIDYTTIEDVEDCDGESANCYGQDAETGAWGWRWVSLETLSEHRPDIVESLEPAGEN